jgi:catalase
MIADELARYPEDVEYAHKFIDRLKARLEERYVDPEQTLRDFHSKLHGLVKARFEVMADLPPELAVGVFSEPRSFQAWVRLSNGQNMVRPDEDKDVRGCAIKLMGVEGAKMLDDETQTQDFVLVNAPVLGIKSVKEFFEIQSAMEEGFLSLVSEVLNPFDNHVRCMFMLNKAMHECANLLECDYWGVGAYALGDKAVKYKLRTSRDAASEVPKSPDQDFLRQRLIADLDDGDQRFDFMVQLRTDPDEMPIEDASILWDEEVSPYRKVAELHVPAQRFDIDERRELNQRMSFQPWHATEAHKPLGGGQVARGIIYREMADFRRRRRGVEPHEPHPEE